jgi:hypothetical protein
VCANVHKNVEGFDFKLSARKHILKKMKEINVSLNSPISYFGVKTGKVLE